MGAEPAPWLAGSTIDPREWTLLHWGLAVVVALLGWGTYRLGAGRRTDDRRAAAAKAESIAREILPAALDVARRPDGDRVRALQNTRHLWGDLAHVAAMAPRRERESLLTAVRALYAWEDEYRQWRGPAQVAHFHAAKAAAKQAAEALGTIAAPPGG